MRHDYDIHHDCQEADDTPEKETSKGNLWLLYRMW